ncbi:MAG TPA: ABC transporter permease [Acidimicrobiales bacterium]|nr:ABC transporter permease [Acidimicrobiales bacterium]
MWPFVINGLSDGSIYAMAAVGLVLTYKTSGIFNFAIGAQAAASAYVFYSFRITDGLPWPLAALLALVLVAGVGSLLLERMAYLLADAPPVMRVVATIGLLVLLQSILAGAYGQTTLQFASFLPQKSFHVGGINVLSSQIIAAVLALAATMGLYLFFKRARLGVAMQAVVDDPNLLALEATSPVVVRRYAWVIGSCFISISGMLIAPELGLDVNNLLLLYIAAFGAAALGAFSSLPITYGSAIGIGVFMNVLSDKLAGQGNATVEELYTQIPFLALILALLFIPQRKLVERGMRRVRRLRPSVKLPPVAVGSIGVVGLGLALLMPYIVAPGFIDLYTTGIGFAVVLASLALVLWTSGQISLCQMAFAAIGATTLVHAQQAGFPWLLAVLVAGLVAVPVGAVVAIPSFRLSGIYLAAATFAFGLLFQNLVYNTFLMFGGVGTVSVKRPSFFGSHMGSDEGYYYTALAIAAACMVIVVLVKRSRLGRLLRGLSDSPVALDAHGTNTKVTRLLAFCISAFLAAIGGALIAGVTQSAGSDPTGPFGYFNSLALVAVLAFCGRRLIFSPIVAAFIFEVLKNYAPFTSKFFTDYEGVFFGVLAIGVAVLPAISWLRPGKRGFQREGRSPVSERLLYEEGAFL